MNTKTLKTIALATVAGITAGIASVGLAEETKRCGSGIGGGSGGSGSDIVVNGGTVNARGGGVGDLTKQMVFDLVHPVGSYWVQYGSTDDPTELFSADKGITCTWEKVTDYDNRSPWVNSGGTAGVTMDGSLPNIYGWFQVQSWAPAGLVQSQLSQFEVSGPFTGIARDQRKFFVETDDQTPKLTMICGVNFSANSANSAYRKTTSLDTDTTVRPTSFTVIMWKRTK